MTTSKTPRLGLMNPVGSDAFLTSDFATTFGLIDQNPGALVVANAAARPTNYTAAQHGSMVWQADLNIVWVWVQPSSSGAGAWQRVGNTGFLGQFQNAGTVSTVVNTNTQGPVVVSGTLMIPGGRPILVTWSWDQMGGDFFKAVLSYWENNVRIFDKTFPGGLPPEAGAGSFWVMRNPAPVSATSVAFQITLSAVPLLPPLGGGSVTITNGTIAVWEL